MIVLGLTGSIGMGKSTTAQMFRDAGVPVFDADQVVHELYRGEAVPAVAALFPDIVRDGVIDRALLRARVMGDPAALHRLEAIVHPMVAERRQAFLAAAEAEHKPVAVLDIPLLFEVGADAAVDAVVVVSADEAVQKARVLARPGMTETMFSAIKAKQVPDADKRARATYVIDTGLGLDHARAEVDRVLRAVMGGSTGS